jgi:hypothetical protein
MTANTTYANMVSDVYKIISGEASNVAQLSANTDSRTQFFGTYPSSQLSVANTASNTFAKIHHTVSSKTHYIRLNWNNTTQKLDNIALAQAYTSETNTLINSATLACGAEVLNFSTTNIGIDIIVSPQMLYIGQGGTSQMGVFDIGHSGLTRTYANSMLMMLQTMQNTINRGNNAGGTIPFSYNMNSLSYGSITTAQSTITPRRIILANGSLSIFENPVFITSTTQASTINVVYGMFKLPGAIYAGAQTYVDDGGLRRLTVNDFSLLTY